MNLILSLRENWIVNEMHFNFTIISGLKLNFNKINLKLQEGQVILCFNEMN